MYLWIAHSLASTQALWCLVYPVYLNQHLHHPKTTTKEVPVVHLLIVLALRPWQTPVSLLYILPTLRVLVQGRQPVFPQ